MYYEKIVTIMLVSLALTVMTGYVNNLERTKYSDMGEQSADRYLRTARPLWKKSAAL